MCRSRNISYIKKNWEFSISILIVVYFVVSQYVFPSSNQRGLNQHLRVVPKEVINYYDHTKSIEVNNNYAYIQYSTSYEYLNLAIMNFITLRSSHTKVTNLVILFDNDLVNKDNSTFQKLENLALKYGIKLRPIGIISARYTDSPEWAQSFTKFHVFDQTEFDRIVYFDSDSMFLNVQIDENDFESSINKPGNLDELFKLPEEFDIILPQAYWLTNNNIKLPKNYEFPTEKRYKQEMDNLVYGISKSDKEIFNSLPTLLFEDHKFQNRKNFFANHIMVLSPSHEVFKALKKYTNNPFYWSITSRSKLRDKTDYDMEILNKFLDDKLLKDKHIKIGILPHKNYGVLTGEFKELWHSRFVAEPQYLVFINKESNEGWDSLKLLPNVKLVHFSDAPLPKPWEDQNNYDYYNEFKIFCYDKNFDVDQYNRLYPTSWKPRLTEDCNSVRIWNWLVDQFHESQKKYWIV